MSNSNNARSTISKNSLSPASVAKESTPKQHRWNTIQTDLLNALETWEELNKKDQKLSPEEEQFQKIKSIIGQLREKLEQF